MDDLPSVKKAKMDSPETLTAVCYICQLSTLPGKLFPKKAIELGVPKGPLFRDFVAGKIVTLEDGRKVGFKSQLDIQQYNKRNTIIFTKETFIKCGTI